MQTFDASSIIYAWDNYPIKQFPTLWKWFASKIEANEFSASQIAVEEVGYKLPDCATWLKEANINVITVIDEIAQEALRIKNLLGILDDNYHPKGVDENDILIISTALIEPAGLVTEESKQLNAPSNKTKFKIPAVCRLPGVAVQNRNFVELIKASGEIF